MSWLLRALSVLVVFGYTLSNSAFSQTSQDQLLQREESAAWEAASAVAKMGPATIPLQDTATLDIPANAAFIPAAEANRVMKALGNSENPGRLGLIVPRDPKSSWLIDVEWIGEGYVKDAEAKDWEPDTMLASIREGTDEQNKQRVERGIPALDIVGWIEKPAYDSLTNRLVWSLAARAHGAPENGAQTVNYNTYALGREGYFSLDLITGTDSIEADKAIVRGALASLRYAPGKRYADFNESTDKVAAYGIAALVGAVVAKKLGLLAVVGIFLLKVWKIALVFLLGGFAAMRRFFARIFSRKHEETEWQSDESVEPVADDSEPQHPDEK